jgi:TM2 domain-containing membrane protein YozV
MIYKPTKNWVVALLLSIFLGTLGIDRFYMGHIGVGIAKLLLSWATFGVWQLIDIVLIAIRKVNDRDFYWDDSAEAHRQTAGTNGFSTGY